VKEKIFLRPENESARSYYEILPFGRLHSAEIWLFRYGLTLGTGILKIMASTSVSVRVICALNNLLRISLPHTA
jgi:hypothetical protein